MGQSKSKLREIDSQPESRFLVLPPELLLIVIPLLSKQDQKTLTWVSRWFRQMVLPFIFGTLTVSRSYHIQNLKNARKDVKAAIRHLTLQEYCHFISWNMSMIFQFIRALPNLESVQWISTPAKYRGRLRCQLNRLIIPLQLCPLEKYPYSIFGVPLKRSKAPLPLKTLAIENHHDHLYDISRSLFPSQVELRIDPMFPRGPRNFDLRPLRPVGRNLKKLVYTLDYFDPSVFDVIPDIFPHLISLNLKFRSFIYPALWKKDYDDALSRNRKLQNLLVRVPKFCGSHYHYDETPICPSCHDQRSKATSALRMVCTGLKTCIWVTSNAQFTFDIDYTEGTVFAVSRRI